MEELDEILEPKKIEVEKYTEKDYDNMLDDCYSTVTMGKFSWNPSYVLSELDPVAYRCGFSDFQEYETKYKCPICEELFDFEEDAKWHCQDEPEEIEEDD